MRKTKVLIVMLLIAVMLVPLGAGCGGKDPEITGITAVFTQGETVVYEDAKLNSLKEKLKVTVQYSKGADTDLSQSDYTLSGKLTAGVSTVTVSYEGKTCTFTVNVTAVQVITGITAVFTQGGAKVYEDDALGSLKAMLTVTAQHNYGDDITLAAADYTLSGKLTPGVSTITVTYAGKTKTFTVDVLAALVVTGITAVFTQGDAQIYENTPLNDLKEFLVVTVSYEAGEGRALAASEYTLSGTLTTGTSTVTAAYKGKTNSFTVDVLDARILTGITAVFTQGGTTVYENSALNGLKPMLVVKAQYDRGSDRILAADDYTLSGALKGSTSTITVGYEGKTATFTVNVTASVANGLFVKEQVLYADVNEDMGGGMMISMVFKSSKFTFRTDGTYEIYNIYSDLAVAMLGVDETVVRTGAYTLHNAWVLPNTETLKEGEIVVHQIPDPYVDDKGATVTDPTQDAIIVPIGSGCGCYHFITKVDSAVINYFSSHSAEEYDIHFPSYIEYNSGVLGPVAAFAGAEVFVWDYYNQEGLTWEFSGKEQAFAGYSFVFGAKGTFRLYGTMVMGEEDETVPLDFDIDSGSYKLDKDETDGTVKGIYILFEGETTPEYYTVYMLPDLDWEDEFSYILEFGEWYFYTDTNRFGDMPE